MFYFEPRTKSEKSSKIFFSARINAYCGTLAFAELRMNCLNQFYGSCIKIKTDSDCRRQSIRRFLIDLVPERSFLFPYSFISRITIEEFAKTIFRMCAERSISKDRRYPLEVTYAPLYYGTKGIEIIQWKINLGSIFPPKVLNKGDIFSAL